ncbi:MAG: T9SS type A sorting domain-containing protein, partial [Chitinophagales bacterium]|nr:T9SS type A sorting domain-containing protein [Chitinophagales bacterium]
CTNGLYFKPKMNVLPSFQTEKLLIAPNPAKEMAKVIWKNEAMANVLRIYRIDGSLVRTIPLMENNSFIELNVSLWPKGIYLLYLSFKDGTFETGRLVR